MDYNLKIESLQNPRIKAAVKLRKRSARQQSGSTLIEGFRELQRATESGWKVQELYFCPELFLEHEAAALVEQLRSQNTPVFQCNEAVFRKISYRDTPDGLIALSPLVGKALDGLELPDCPLILIAAELEKPGNLGTILRTADAAGVDAVIVCDPKTDLNNPNVIRASVGTLFFLPIAEASTEETLTWLNKHNIQSLAAVPDAPQIYTSVDMKRSTAIVVGAEDNGLSERWKQNASVNISIPMVGQNDSLNVSTAAAILLYEALRQRNIL